VSSRTTWGYIAGQFVGYVLLATVLFVAYARLNARFDQEARAQDARVEKVLQQTRQLITGLSDYIECVAIKTRENIPTAPVAACQVYLGKGNP
jgi:large-conductance mechanosensitive channel